jgi:hypothetical protein
MVSNQDVTTLWKVFHSSGLYVEQQAQQWRGKQCHKPKLPAMFLARNDWN